MALRTGHGNGRGRPHVEVCPADELPAPIAAPAKTDPPLNRCKGKIVDSATARALGSRGGITTARRVRLIDSLGLSKLIEAT